MRVSIAILCALSVFALSSCFNVRDLGRFASQDWGVYWDKGGVAQEVKRNDLIECSQSGPGLNESEQCMLDKGYKFVDRPKRDGITYMKWCDSSNRNTPACQSISN